MTAEEKASWKRWHETGRRRYQFRSAIRWLGVGLLNALFVVIVVHPGVSWVGPFTIAGLTGVSVYFFAGHHWDARDEEYRWLTNRDGQA